MEHRGDQFDRKIIQKEQRDQKSEMVDTDKTASSSDEGALGERHTETDLKSLMSSSIRRYTNKEPQMAETQPLEVLSGEQYQEDEISLKSLVGCFIFAYIFFLVLFEMIAVTIAFWSGIDIVLLSSCIIGLVLAFILAYYFGWTGVPKKFNRYKELQTQYIASVVFYAIVVPLVPVMLLFGLCG